MATEKQIAANRANAKRSTGPKTGAGKKRSSQNALRHGLSRSPSDEFAVNADRLARAISALTQADHSVCFDFAYAQLGVERVRRVKASLMVGRDALTDPSVLKQLLATERYERRALTKRYRAANVF
jgi:hypothetical protein